MATMTAHVVLRAWGRLVCKGLVTKLSSHDWQHFSLFIPVLTFKHVKHLKACFRQRKIWVVQSSSLLYFQRISKHVKHLNPSFGIKRNKAKNSMGITIVIRLGLTCPMILVISISTERSPSLHARILQFYTLLSTVLVFLHSHPCFQIYPPKRVFQTPQG